MTPQKFVAWSLALLICFGTPLQATTFTADYTTFYWSDVFNTATNADTCVIPAGTGILCPANVTCTCGRIDLDGNLVVAEDATFVPGDPSNNQANAIDIDGTLTINGTMTVNCAANGQANCEVSGNSGGQMLVRGRKVTDGTVTSVVKEICPQGYLDPAIDTTLADGPDECSEASEYDVSILVSFPVLNNQYNGMRLYFPPPFSGHQGTYYDIRDSVSPNKLVLNGASRGQLLPHGAVLTKASVSGMNGTTATITTLGTDAYRLAVVGGWLSCDSDCDPVTINESSSPTGIPSHEIRLPCTHAARIVAAPNVTTLTLAAASTGAGCGAAPGAGRITIEPGSNWPRVEPVEAVRVGDVFEIVKPAVLSIPQANKGITLVYATSGVSTQDKNWVMDVANNFVLDAQYFDWGYCGRLDDAAFDACISSNMTSANTTGYKKFQNGEFYFTSGLSNVTEIEEQDDFTMRYVTHRDSAYSDNNDVGDQHGFLIGTNDAFPGSDINITGLVCRRVNDDCVYDGPDLIGDDDWRNISIIDSGTVWMPNNTPGGATAEHIQFNSASAGITGRLKIDRNFVIDVESGIALALAEGRAEITNTAIVNTEYGFGGTSDAGGNSTFAGRPTFIGNVACIRCGETATPLKGVGRISASYSDSGNKSADAGEFSWANLGSLYGVVLDGSNEGSAIYQYDPGSTTASKFEVGGPVLKDVVIINGTAGAAGVFQRSGITVNASHISWVNGTADNSGTLYWTRTLSPSGGTIRVKDSLFYGLLAVIDSNNGLPGTWDVNNNLTLAWSTGFDIAGMCAGANCAGCCGAANVVLTGDLGVMSPRNPLVLPGSAARTVTTSDNSTYVGARCAGPTNWPLLERLSSAVSVAGRAGVVDPALCVDADGDTWWDIHDPCPRDADPLAGSCR